MWRHGKRHEYQKNKACSPQAISYPRTLPGSTIGGAVGLRLSTIRACAKPPAHERHVDSNRHLTTNFTTTTTTTITPTTTTSNRQHQYQASRLAPFRSRPPLLSSSVDAGCVRVGGELLFRCCRSGSATRRAEILEYQHDDHHHPPPELPALGLASTPVSGGPPFHPTFTNAGCVWWVLVGGVTTVPLLR